MILRSLFPALLLFLPLAAQGERDLTVGGTFHQTGAAWEGPVKLGHENTGGLVLDFHQDLERGPGRGALRLETGANGYLRFESLGLGLQRQWRADPQPNQVSAYVGIDLRLEHLRGRALDPGQQGVQVWVADPIFGSGWRWEPHPVDLTRTEAWLLRPWARAGLTVRGLWIPDPLFFMTGHSLLAWFTQGGRDVHPLTRLEVATPLWRQGGASRTGQLRQMAPAFELSYQLGARF